MTEITSKAAGLRVLNVVTGKDEDGKPIIEQRVIQPRETLDVELFKPEHPSTKAMFDGGDLVYGRPEDEAKAEADARSAELRAEYDRGFADGQKAQQQAQGSQKKA